MSVERRVLTLSNLCKSRYVWELKENKKVTLPLVSLSNETNKSIVISLMKGVMSGTKPNTLISDVMEKKTKNNK